MSYRIFVGKLSDRTTRESISKAFSEYGEIKDVEVKNGYGFVFYDDANAAQNAIEKMNGVDLDGSAIVVENARAAKDSKAKLMNRRLDLRIIVRGLSPRVSWQDLKDWGREAGDVTFTNIFDDDRGQRLGIVEFKDEQGLDNALRVLEGVTIHGGRVRVEKDDPDAPHHNIPPSRGLENRRGGGPGFGGRHGNNFEPRGRDNYDRQEPPAPYSRGRSSEPPYGRDRGFDRGGFNGRGGGPSFGPPGAGFDGPPRGGYDRGYESRRPYSDEYRRSPPPMPMPAGGAGGGGGGGYYRDRSRSRSRSRGDRYYGGYGDRAPNVGPGGFARSRGGYEGGRPGEFEDRRPGGGNGPRYYDGPRGGSGYENRR